MALKQEHRYLILAIFCVKKITEYPSTVISQMWSTIFELSGDMNDFVQNVKSLVF